VRAILRGTSVENVEAPRAHSPEFDLDRDRLTPCDREALLKLAANNVAWLLRSDVTVSAAGFGTITMKADEAEDPRQKA
jgi:hypothetical protein